MRHSGDATRRPLGSRRGTFRVAAAVLSVAAWCTMSVPQAIAFTVPVGQALVVVLHDQVARTAPSMDAHAMATIASRRPLTGVRTVLPVLGHANSTTGRAWVDVRLPGRPNGSTGWITTSGTMPSWTRWRLSVDLTARLVTVYDRGRVTVRFPAVVGAPSTPTPQGQFFIEEGLSLSAQAAGAPFALATSARSNVLQQFDGGPGQIALHGMGNLAGALGTASSHGCIRLATPAITWLAMHIGAGVPLSILP
ncbi:MAG: L,D-transpeptidase [Actinomycetota bacterium]|nr:L,D-transpeptidase [Actinomycetota bacterium]